jgi:hypothetical protein
MNAKIVISDYTQAQELIAAHKRGMGIFWGWKTLFFHQTLVEKSDQQNPTLLPYLPLSFSGICT